MPDLQAMTDEQLQAELHRLANTGEDAAPILRELVSRSAVWTLRRSLNLEDES
jgi:hypothetical protein